MRSALLAVIFSTTKYKTIEKMTTKGTIRLLGEMKRLAISDKKRYGKKATKKGSSYISIKTYESAVFFLDEQLPVIREILGESFKD